MQHHSRASGTFLQISGTRGVQQGDVVAALMFCAAMHPIICRVLERHPGVYAVCYADNIYLVGRASVVFPAQVDLDRNLLQDLGVASKPSEAYVYAPIWEDVGLAAPPQSFFDMVERVAPQLTSTIHERVRVAGIEVLGCPLGNDNFVTEFLDSRVEDIAKDFGPCAQVDDGIAFSLLSRSCIMTRLGYSLRTSYPQLSVRSAKSLDEHMLRAWGDYVGWGRSAVAPDASGEEVKSWLRHGLFGSMDDGWLGMPMLELTTEASFHSAAVRWIAWLLGPKGPAMWRETGSITAPESSMTPSLYALKLAHQQLLEDGAQERGAPPGDPGAVGVAALTLPPLDMIRETLRLAGPQLPGVAKSSPFATQAQLSKLSLRRRGTHTRLLCPLPEQVEALARGRSRRGISMVPGVDETDSSSTVKKLCKDYSGTTFEVRPMSVWASVVATPACLKINREETAVLVCMWMGMEVKSCVALPGGGAPSCFGCGKQVDTGGHHAMACNKSAAFNAAHIRVQDTLTTFAKVSDTTRVASTTRTGLPHEKPVGGRKADIAVTVVRAPTKHGCRLHEREGVSALCLDVTVVHPFTSKGNLVPSALVDAGKAKNTKHAWLLARGFGFAPFVCSTLGAVANDAYRVLFLISLLRAEKLDSVALAAAGGDARAPHKSVEQRRGEIFARQRSVLMLTCLRAGALRLTGKHWDRGLTAAQRRAVAARDLADEEDERDALAGAGAGGDVVQAYPVG